MTVNDLIEELKKCPPNAIVTYAYGEYNRNTLHGFISTDLLILVDEKNVPIYFEQEVITCLPEDIEDQIDEIRELLTVPGNKWVPAIQLFSE